MPDSSTPTTTPTTAVAKSAAKKTFQQLVDSDSFKSQIALALPKHLTADRFIRVLMTATIKQPKLLECTQTSMFKGIFDCAAVGLELDGRRAHLVPFRNKGVLEATLIVDYKGLAELAMRSGVVSNIHADIVCESDVFEVDRGVITKHTVDYRKERGEMYAVYCIIRMKDGGEKAEVMSTLEVDRIRKRSKSGDDGPWVTDFAEMAKKTVFKRASKWVPLSAEIRNVVEGEDAALGGDEPTNVTPKSSLASLIGAPSAELGAGGHIEHPEADEKAPAKDDKPAVEAKTYTPEQRAAHLANVQSAMLDHSVSESKVMVYVHQQKLAREGQDEVGTLDTSVLEALVVIVPTLAAPKAK